MNLERRTTGKRKKRKPSRRYGLRLFLLVVVVGIGVGLGFQLTVQAPEGSGTAVTSPAPTPEATVSVDPVAEKERELLDYEMTSLTDGWARYSDGLWITTDSGLNWTASEEGMASPAPAVNLPGEGNEEPVSWMSGKLQQPQVIHVGTNAYAVRKSQFLTRNVGWVQLAEGSKAESPLWVTVDAGITWHPKVTAVLAEAMRAEGERLAAASAEAPLYAGMDTAQQVMESPWSLLPETAAPGDAVLVRSAQPGEVTWEGKTYKLAPFGTGYFTYLPLSLSIKPGSYLVGEATLTVKPKKFETQYLKVTKQMESMKQDSARIAADQKLIDQARSTSEGEFLFNGPFVKPVEGILTTPYGYTRYVNGKLDNSHRAIDLAAPEGTPVMATNDGVVALAEPLYLTGNAIYIDHGMGLFSQYAHLSKLNVKAGDRVKQGDIIGLVGTTGFSTGPHLHFTFWAHNVPVNPDLFFGTTPFQWLKAGSAGGDGGAETGGAD